MAGPSAADVRSILSLPTPNTAGPSQLRKVLGAPERAKKPEGISRELYSLIGPSAPTLAAQLAKPRLKQKPNLGGGGRVKWEWRSFKNGARGDSLRLSHWVKAGSDPDADYSFAKYNVQPNVFIYSQDEYTRYLTDHEWTKEETDYLFDVVREYDARWYIIADRYDYPGGQPRTMEDLKDRYASVCRKLIRTRPWAGDEASRSQLLSSFSFDKDRELLRKRYVASLESRTPEQIMEEDALFVELKRLEQNERRFKKDREELLRTLLGMESGLPDINADEEAFSSNAPVEVKKSKKKGNNNADVETPTSATASGSGITLGHPIPKKQAAKSAAYDALHCIHRTDVPPQTTLTTTKAAHQPVYLRSYKLPTPKSSAAPKITTALTELGIRADRLVMPTRDNCALLESLIDATSSLVEMKKQVDRIDHEIRVAQERLVSRNTEGQDVEMDVDEEVGEDGRGQSVVSTRSGRSTKAPRKVNSRRSMSVSSVDTSATGSTKRKRT